MKVKTESEVAQSCPTLRDPMDCSLPGSSIHGIFPGKSTGVGCQINTKNKALFMYSIIIIEHFVYVGGIIDLEVL